VPKKSLLTIRNEKGDISVSDMGTPVSINNGSGDIEVRNTAGDVSIDTHKGATKVSDTNGNVKISGRGGEVSVTSATGGLTLDGEFFRPHSPRTKWRKACASFSQRTDLTLTQLSGHLEAGSGNLEITDAPGNLKLAHQSLRRFCGKCRRQVKIDNRDGNVELRFSAPPKEDIEVSNAASGITLTLPGSSSFEILADCHSCDIDSEFSGDSLKKNSMQSGDSHLEGKYGSCSRPQNYFENQLWLDFLCHRTSSDMPVAKTSNGKSPNSPISAKKRKSTNDPKPAGAQISIHQSRQPECVNPQAQREKFPPSACEFTKSSAFAHSVYGRGPRPSQPVSLISFAPPAS